MRVIAIKEKDFYRYDPGHRRKPGTAWIQTEAGWTKPRPGKHKQKQQVVQNVVAPMDVAAHELIQIARLLV